VKILAQVFIVVWVIWLAVLLVGCLLQQFIGSRFTDWLTQIHIWWWFLGSLTVLVFGEGILRKMLRDK
jgi:hypothetical protein